MAGFADLFRAFLNLGTTGNSAIRAYLVDEDGNAASTGGGGGGSGTQYTEGATDASITGTAVMWEAASDTLSTVSTATPLPVEIISGGGGGGGGTEYTEGDIDSSITGTAILWEDTSNTLRAVSAAKPLPVSGGLTDAELRATAVPVSLSGMATAANQATGNTSLSNIDGKLPSLASGKIPVDVQATTGLTDTQLRATPVPISDGSGSITVDGTVTANIGTSGSLATAANQTTANSSLSSIDGKLPSLSSGRVPVDVQGTTGLTDTQLRASAVPVSVSGVATAANQSTANTSLSSIDGKLPSLSSGRVPIDGSGVTQPVSASSLPLPTGAASAANQSTVITAFGSNSDSASATGSAHAKLRQIAEALTGASATATTTTIANGSATSGTITLNGRSLLAVAIPSTWTTANLGIQVTFDGGTNWINLRTEAGGFFVIATTTAGSCYDITQSAVLSRLGVPFRFRSCSASNPSTDVTQGADRTLNYIYA